MKQLISMIAVGHKRALRMPVRILGLVSSFMRSLAIAPLVGLLCIAGAGAQTASGTSPIELRTQFAQMNTALRDNAFKRPLVLASQEASGRVRGDVFALMSYPFTTVRQALQEPANWCEVLILHPNTKQCRKTPSGSNVLRVSVGKKTEQAAEDAFHLDMNYALVSSSPDYFQVRLTAQEGPLGTSDYRIVVEAVAVNGTQSFLHLSYSYRESWAGQMATKAYMATAGRAKVGFSTTGDEAGGKPKYVGGMRGAVERNAMRYYLAIDAYLQSPGDHIDKRLGLFFAATEQYPLQLHEMDRSTYMAIKQREYQRQQVGTGS